MARAAGLGQTLPEESMISFEDPADVVRLITAARLALFRSVKEMPGSITEISERLHSDRSTIKRDIDELAWAQLRRVPANCVGGGAEQPKSLFLARVG